MSTYPIDPNVRRIATRFGIDPALIMAIVKAEGGTTKIVKAVQCSVPSITTLDQALEITCRSAIHRMWEHVKEIDPDGYISYLGSKWAPVGVKNDPKGLNKNWTKNVLKLWIPE